MRARAVLILTILGLAMAVTAAPVAAGGSGSLAIGNAGADGELGATFHRSFWGLFTLCSYVGSDILTPGIVDEFRTAFEFPLSALPAGATITSATLSLRDQQGGLPDQFAIYGYAGDGVMRSEDVQVTGTPVLYTPTTAVAREDHDVTALLTVNVVTAGWAGFSLRMEPLDVTFPGILHTFDCPHLGEMYPILTITYDLPPPTPTPVASLLSTGIADPDTSPSPVLGFAALLLAALGAVAFVNKWRGGNRPVSWCR